MPCDYQAISNLNEGRYGWDIDRVGQMLFADRYSDRTHFIFELLQNAEDALARRPAGWQGSRSVAFHLTERGLRVGHFGHPFDENDVHGICGIAESKKGLTDIGQFGIGFKSVYVFTDRPEVHSGEEDFAIENFVLPVAVPPLDRNAEETIIEIPLKDHYEDEIAKGLGQLGASTLLFLRQIEEIYWSVDGEQSGLYRRETSEIDIGVRRITVIGPKQAEREADEEWLVFSRPVNTDNGDHAGHVEIAFSITNDEKSKRDLIKPIDHSPLVVFFPTVLETYLGFLVQGPYRTTPSRDNVPSGDPWNKRLVQETASLLIESLHWMRDRNLLDTTTLGCLPLDSNKSYGMFAPLFAATEQALSSEPLLPRFDTGYVPAVRALLACTQELRELFTPIQLSTLFGEKQELSWLTGDITWGRTPKLLGYLMWHLRIAELTPEKIIKRLDKPFLETQSDAWIQDLYEFLSGQPALRQELSQVPLIRLKDGTQVVAYLNGQPQAFLPGEYKTGFPAVRVSVCATDTAREFLRSLGLTEPDRVDDVVRYVLPKYQGEKINVTDADYEADIQRILAAFATDSKGQREKLKGALRQTYFVRTVDMGDDSKWWMQPRSVYWATDRLKELFAGVRGVYLVDDAYACLRDEEVQRLLEDCEAAQYLEIILEETDLTQPELADIRRSAGLEQASWEKITDRTLRGLQDLLSVFPRLEPEARRRRAGLLWEALVDVANRYGSWVFQGEYRWGYAQIKKTGTFDAMFVRHLNATPWVPDANGELQSPKFVIFKSLGWKEDPFLLSKIGFKAPIIDQLAREIGIEPGVLDLLKAVGVTSEAHLRERLGLSEEQTIVDEGSSDDVKDSLGRPGITIEAGTPVTEVAGKEPSGSGREMGGGLAGDGVGASSGYADSSGSSGKSVVTNSGADAVTGKPTSGGAGGTPFISYVATHPDEEESDPDGLDQVARMALETQAINLILSHEPKWLRTPPGNPGYDLFVPEEDGKETCWCEVKAMTASLHDRPVGLSRTQFEFAQRYREAYWLYVVEHAGTERARIVRIQDPAGRVRTFTFDYGWLTVANVDYDRAHPED